MTTAKNNTQFVFLCPYENGLHRLVENVYLPEKKKSTIAPFVEAKSSSFATPIILSTRFEFPIVNFNR